MSNLTFDGMAIAGGVVETIVAIAVQDVDGVAQLAGSSAPGILSGRKSKPAAKGVEVIANDDDTISVAVRIIAQYGYALPAVADAIREAVADAITMQIGLATSNVDVYIDGIQFS